MSTCRVCRGTAVVPARVGEDGTRVFVPCPMHHDRPLASDKAVTWRKYAEELEALLDRMFERAAGIDRRLAESDEHPEETGGETK